MSLKIEEVSNFCFGDTKLYNIILNLYLIEKVEQYHYWRSVLFQH